MADLRFIDDKRAVQSDKFRSRKKCLKSRKSNCRFELPLVGDDLYIITAGFGKADLIVVQLVDLTLRLNVSVRFANRLIIYGAFSRQLFFRPVNGHNEPLK